MSAIGTGYDLSCTTFSTDGRIFQVEYAQKAADASGTVLGIRTPHGVVLACEQLLASKMLVRGENKRIITVDRHIGACTSGVLADGRCVVERARSECASHKTLLKEPMPARFLTERVAQYMQMFTMYGSVRPFGAAVLFGGVDSEGSYLSLCDPSGLSYGFWGVAAGKAKQAAKAELDKLKFENLTMREAVLHAARIIYAVHDEQKDKNFELEIGWICEESGNQFALIPSDLFAEAETAAKAAKDDDDDDE